MDTQLCHLLFPSRLKAASYPLMITEFACLEQKVRGKEKDIDKEESCIVEVAGDTITILDSGGVNNKITWKIDAEDNCGNSTTAICEVLVERPERP